MVCCTLQLFLTPESTRWEPGVGPTANSGVTVIGEIIFSEIQYCLFSLSLHWLSYESSLIYLPQTFIFSLTLYMHNLLSYDNYMKWLMQLSVRTMWVVQSGKLLLQFIVSFLPQLSMWFHSLASGTSFLLLCQNYLSLYDSSKWSSLVLNLLDKFHLIVKLLNFLNKNRHYNLNPTNWS